MSREVRRVPLDFDQPIGEVWEGYLMPDELQLPQCPDCEGSGWGPLARWLGDTFYALGLHGVARELTQWSDKITDAEVALLANEGRLHQWKLFDWVEFDPPQLNEHGRKKGELVRNDKPMPTAAEVNAADRTPRGVHDAINRHILIKYRCQQQGQDPDCPTCQGVGDVGTLEQREAYENWEGIEPPTGEGWQLWETTSEGSPKSPVFATGEKLIQWMSTNPCGFAGARISLDVARKWVNGSGWSPSMISTGDGRLLDGISGVVAVRKNGEEDS